MCARIRALIPLQIKRRLFFSAQAAPRSEFSFCFSVRSHHYFLPSSSASSSPAINLCRSHLLTFTAVIQYAFLFFFLFPSPHFRVFMWESSAPAPLIGLLLIPSSSKITTTMIRTRGKIRVSLRDRGEMSAERLAI